MIDRSCQKLNPYGNKVMKTLPLNIPTKRREPLPTGGGTGMGPSSSIGCRQKSWLFCNAAPSFPLDLGLPGGELILQKVKTELWLRSQITQGRPTPRFRTYLQQEPPNEEVVDLPAGSVETPIGSGEGREVYEHSDAACCVGITLHHGYGIAKQAPRPENLAGGNDAAVPTSIGLLDLALHSLDHLPVMEGAAFGGQSNFTGAGSDYSFVPYIGVPKFNLKIWRQRHNRPNTKSKTLQTKQDFMLHNFLKFPTNTYAIILEIPKSLSEYDQSFNINTDFSSVYFWWQAIIVGLGTATCSDTITKISGPVHSTWNWTHQWVNQFGRIKRCALKLRGI